MPYIAIKALPKDERIKRAAVEKINEVMLEIWGGPQEALTISVEEIGRDDWGEKVQKPDIDAHPEIMMILAGKKTYEDDLPK